MIRKLVVLLSIVVVVLAATIALNGPQWQARSATDKENVIWSALTAARGSSGSFPNPLQLAQIFIESLAVSFDTTADDMPNTGLFGARRPKLIHSVGAVSKFQWKSIGNHGYTGLFKGVDHGFLRFSLATAPTSSAITPGIGVKALRSGVRSGNFVVMYALTGQPEFNFFKHDLTNHVPALATDAPTALKLLDKAFQKASSWESMVGLSDFATYDQDGNQEANPNFPYRLIFHPDKRVRGLFPDEKPDDFDFVSDLTSISAGPAYWVYAEPVPNAGPILIGQITITSDVVQSSFGDQVLFIQHQRMEDDLNVHPEWVDAAKSIVDSQTSADSQFVYPDLPDPSVKDVAW